MGRIHFLKEKNRLDFIKMKSFSIKQVLKRKKSTPTFLPQTCSPPGFPISDNDPCPPHPPSNTRQVSPLSLARNTSSQVCLLLPHPSVKAKCNVHLPSLNFPLKCCHSYFLKHTVSSLSSCSSCRIRPNVVQSAYLRVIWFSRAEVSNMLASGELCT